MTQAPVPQSRPMVSPSIGSLTNAQRAAIILSLLEPDQARGLAERFDSGRTERAIEAFEHLPMVGRSELMDVITSFLKALEGEAPLVAGGRLRADELADALIAPTFAEMSDEPILLEDSGSIEDGADASAIWAYVRALDPSKLGPLLAEERPAIISAVLNQLNREGASAVLSSLPSEKASSVVRQMFSGRKPSMPTYDAIAESLRRVAPDRLADQEEEGFDPLEIAGIFNRMSATRQSSILDPLKTVMPDEVEAVEKHLLSFPNLHLRLPKTVVPTMFREMDNGTLDVALGHAFAQQAETAEFLLGSISQRLAEQIRERIEEQPKIVPSDGEEAQAEIIRLLIEWSEEGRFVFKFPDLEDQE